MTAQFIEIDGKKLAVLPIEEYQKMLDQLEMQDDIRFAEEADRRRLAGEEYFPGEIVDKLLNGENPLRVWRTYRGLSQQELADKVGCSKMKISSLETGKQDTSSGNWRKLAEALNLNVDDIMPWPEIEQVNE